MEQMEQIPKEMEEISSEENGLSQIQNKIFFNKISLYSFNTNVKCIRIYS